MFTPEEMGKIKLLIGIISVLVPVSSAIALFTLRRVTRGPIENGLGIFGASLAIAIAGLILLNIM